MEAGELTLVGIAEMQQPYVLEMRRALHRMPETRWQEERTLAFIRDSVGNLLTPSYAYANGTWDIVDKDGGLVVDFTRDADLPRRMLRADVDGLPIKESTGLPFTSETEGNMHACGHDIHCAMLLGAIKAIAQRHVVPNVNLRFVFQRAEENPGTAPNPISGGKRLVEEGVLEGVHDVHGLHIWAHPGTKPGTFYYIPGQAMANSDRIKMVIACSGGHVMNPEHGSNAIDIAIDVCNGLKGFALRTLGPDEAVSLVPAIFTSGTGSNIRPDRAELWFGNRHFLKPEMRTAFATVITKHVGRIVNQYPDASFDIHPIEGHPMLFNDLDDVARVEATMKAHGLSTQQHQRLFGGEDFAYYLQQRPGSFWFLSGLQDGCGDHHTPTFNPDESVFHLGTAFWLLLATEPEPHPDVA